MSDYLGDLNPANLINIVRRLTRDVAILKGRTVSVTTLDELTTDMGVLRNGAFYAGEGDFENNDFVGTAMVYPSIEYPPGSGEFWSILGIDELHILQCGMDATTGHFIWGGGTGRLTKDGLTIEEAAMVAYPGADAEPNGITFINNFGSAGWIQQTANNFLGTRWQRYAVVAPMTVSSVDANATMNFRITHYNSLSPYIAFELSAYGRYAKVYSADNPNSVFYFDTDNERLLIVGESDPVLRLAEGGSASEYVELVDQSATVATLRKIGSGATLNIAADHVSMDGLFNLKKGDNLTIAGGEITVVKAAHSINGEGGAADDLTAINGGTTGDILVLNRVSASGTVTVKDGTGSLRLAGDCVLDSATDTLTLMNFSSVWYEISRSNNA